MWFLGGVVLAFGVLGISEYSHFQVTRDTQSLVQSFGMSTALTSLQASINAAETGQRGYILTGDKSYLEPYTRALSSIEADLEKMRTLSPGMPDGAKRLQVVKLVGQKLAEMQTTLALYDGDDKEAALKVISTNVGRDQMRDLDALLLDLETTRENFLDASIRAWAHDQQLTRIGMGLLAATTVLMLLLLARKSLAEIRAQGDRTRQLLEQQAELEQTVRERTAELTGLAESLQRVTEEERAKLARELHDELGAILTSSKMALSWVVNRLPAEPPELPNRLRTLMKSLDEGIALKRRIIEDLRPSALTHLGLATTVVDYVDTMADKAGLKRTHSVDEVPDIDPEASIAVYRVIQEALTNIMKYAKATSIDVELRNDDDGLRLKISDDGEGFDVDRVSQVKKHGLVGMRQRIQALSGQFAVTSEKGAGTVVTAFIPWPDESVSPPSAEVIQLSA
jgi:signal transduction histidine kinase